MHMTKSSWDQAFKNVFMLSITAMLFFIAWQIREIFTPLIIASLIAYFFSPLINLLRKKTDLPRKTSANIIFFVAVAVIILLLFTVVPYAISEGVEIVTNLNQSLISYEIKYTAPILLLGRPILHPGELIKVIRENLSGDFSIQSTNALQLVSKTSRGFLWFLVIIVTTYNLMTEWDRFREWLVNLAPSKYHDDVWKLYGEIKVVWNNYLAGQIRLMILLALIYSASWAAIGLPGALVIGSLAGFLNLVPEVGPALAAGIALIVAWLQGSTFLPINNEFFALLTGSIYLVLNNVKTIYLQPKILGKSVYLPEGVVFVAIIAAVILEGFLGVLIVVPLLASIFIIARYTRAKLLGLDPFGTTK